MWGGHSCPPLLVLIFMVVLVHTKWDPESTARSKPTRTDRSAQRERANLLLHGCAGLELDQDSLHWGVADVLGIMRLSRFELSGSGFGSGFLRLAVGKCKSDLAIGQEHDNQIGMAMHDRLLMRAIVKADNTDLGILRFDFVVGGVGLDRVLGEGDRR